MRYVGFLVVVLAVALQLQSLPNTRAGKHEYVYARGNLNPYSVLFYNAATVPTYNGYWAVGEKEKPTTLYLILKGGKK